ncbi:recombination protein NinG [Enterobacter hormaechei subsp. xiangfangensis]|nr:recombination protein NinG [Enterobacter hormaechei subsp. xiangfangensis]
MRKPSRRKCKVCGEYFVPKFHDIRIRWCCPEHGAILAMEEREKEKVKAAAKRIKERKEKERAERRDLKARKVALKTKPQWRAEAQAAFNLHNTASQCVYCNRDRDGAQKAFEQGLIERIGAEKVEAINNDNSVRRFDIQYLQRIKSIFTRKARALEKRRARRQEAA